MSTPVSQSDNDTALQQITDDAFRAEQVRQVFSTSIPATLISFINAVILSAVQWGVSDRTTIVLWLGTGMLITAYRYHITRINLAAFARGEAVTDQQRSELYLSIGLFSLYWCTAVLLLFPAGDLTHQFFLTFIMTGMTAGAAISMSIDHRLLHIYLVPTILLLSLRLLLEQSPITTAMAILGPFYLTALLIFAAKQRIRLYENVRLRVQSQRDAQQLRMGDMAFEANEAMLIADASSHIVRSNNAFSHLTGYSSEEVIGKKANLLKSGKHDAGFYRAMWHHLNTTGNWEGEIWNKDKDGNIFPCWLTITLVRDAAGEVSNYIASYTDISELKSQHDLLSMTATMEFAMSRLLQLALGDTSLKTYLDETLSMVVNSVPSIEIKPQGAIFLCSKEQAEMLDLVASYDLAPQLMTMCRRIPFGHCLCGRVAESRKPLFADQLDHRHDIHFDGIKEHGHHILPLMQGDELLGVLNLYVEHGHRNSDMELEYLKRIAHIISLGITRRYSDQRMSEARELAEKASQAKSEFLSSMSHELRTPLNAIMGFAQLLEMESDDPAQLDQVREISRASQHLLELINEILDLAKIEAGKMSLELRDVALQGVAEECTNLAQSMAQSRRITLQNRIADPTLSVKADQVRLKQVLLNLISNGIKYNRDGGSLGIDAELRPDNRLCIRVTDSGIGLSQEQCEQLFQPFERLGQQHVEGTGIGLVITRRLIELMGGTIGVESKLGEGSTFWIELPQGASLTGGEHTGESAQESTQASLPAHTTASTVLYIEDNPVNIKLVQKLLDKRPDIHLVTAMDPSTGLFLAAQQRPDLILLDINLPDMDGYEVFKRLRETELTATTPVIGLSANALNGDIEKARTLGFNDYITKPIRVKDFFSSIDRWLQHDSEA